MKLEGAAIPRGLRLKRRGALAFHPTIQRQRSTYEPPYPHSSTTTKQFGHDAAAAAAAGRVLRLFYSLAIRVGNSPC
jgi:hypothetical protein